MGGLQTVPIVPCTMLRGKILEENNLLNSFTGALRAGIRWGNYRLGDDEIVQDLKEQKTRLEQVLKLLEGEN